jgi:inhibitor of cysteine peptidase
MRTAILICVAMSVAGCGQAPVSLDDNNSDRAITLAIDQEFVVALESNPTTGYDWSFEFTRDGVVVADGSSYEPMEPMLVGSGGTKRFRFIAEQPGQTTLKFEYRRSWETEVPPLRTVTYDLVVR